MAAPQDEVGEVDLLELLAHEPEPAEYEKATTLARLQLQGVQRITNLSCDLAPVLALDVLRIASPSLEQVQVLNPREEHLLAVHTMPELRRLLLQWDQNLTVEPVLPALPQPGSLQWLYTYKVPRPTLVSLLTAHCTTLKELILDICTPAGREWPLGEDGNGLDELLQRCGCHLSRVLLERGHGSHSTEACRAQVFGLRRAQPGATIQCSRCDNVGIDQWLF